MSLNFMMLKGEQLTPHILEVSLRLRLMRYLLTADISKAFMRMGLNENDRNFTLFYVRRNWADPNSPVEIWRFKSVLFGATSSPFLLNCTVADILEHNNYPENLEVFVDNLFTLVAEEVSLRPAITNLIEIFHNTGMPLHEFACNAQDVNKFLRSEQLMTESETLKVLGMKWDFKSDMFFINDPSFQSNCVTKRSILSAIARIFDPCGFLSPVSIIGRILVQEAWEANMSWDDELPSDMQEKWFSFMDQMKDALSIPIPRWIGMKDLSDISVHCFTDASEKALGMVIYLVSRNCSVMYTAKAKICPIRMAHFTIPRKELTGFSLGARYLKTIMKTVAKYFTPTSVHLWSDSTTTLQWVTDKKGHKELYIRSRVDEILKKVELFNIKIHYILGINNPADLMTKPSQDPLRCKLWKEGPAILAKPEQWQPYVASQPKVDAVPIFCGKVNKQQCQELPDVSEFDSIKDLYIATGQKCGTGAKLQPQDIAKAELIWVKHTQQNNYADVFEFLSQLKGAHISSVDGKKIIRKKKLSAPSICHSHHLFLDSDGLIRVHTSLAKAPNLCFDQKFPYLLPVTDPFTILLLKFSHENAGHMGLNYTRAQLRRRFWVPNVTCAIKKLVAACDVCKVERGKRYHVPDSPALPDFRFNVEEPFSVVAVDMLGHDWVSNDDKSLEKIYFFFFVCVSTGCGHVEMAPDASSSSFVNVFDRFLSRRGAPHMLIRDHGSNFTGYENELKTLAEDQLVESFLFDKGI